MQKLPYIIPLIFGFIVSIITIIYLLNNKSISRHRTGVMLLTGCSVWILAYILELLSTDIQIKIILSKIQYIGIVIVPLSFFMLTLSNTGRSSWITMKKILLFSIIPLITLVLVFTNELHGLIWTKFSLDATGIHSLQITQYGSWFWVWTIYAYLLLFASYIFLFTGVIEKFKIYRLQAGIMIIALSIPLIANILYILRIPIFSKIDITPLSLIASSSILMYGFSSLKIGEITPIENKGEFENSKDSTIILDNKNRVLYINPIGQNMFEDIDFDHIGKPINKLLPGFDENNFNSFDIINDFTYIKGNQKYFFNLLVKPYIDSQNNIRGKILVFMDITEKKEADEKIRSLVQFQNTIIENANIWLNVSDNESNIIIWNKAAEVISGYSKKEVIGNKRIWAWLYPDNNYRNSIEAKAKAIIEEGHIVDDFETIIHCKNGEYKIISWNSRNLLDEHDKAIGSIALGRDITIPKKMENELLHLATNDSLTDLYNRAFFEEQMKLLSKERNVGVGILVIDIDGLKYINDALGHHEGDKILIEVSRVLSKMFRSSDVVARIGGDEFSVLMRDTNRIKIETVAVRLKLRINEYNNHLKKRQNQLNISVGYSIKDSKQKTMEQTFKEANEMLFNEKIPKREDVRASILAVLKATIFEKDSITEEHMERLKNIAIAFGDVMHFSDEEKKILSLTTELHDIGKVIIPDHILNKKDRLNREEFEQIKKHSEAGYRIAKATVEIAHIADYILYSHERWDGRGYPKGLKETEIPLISRMVYILDSYDAMMHDRPYRKALTQAQAIDELLINAGTQFDPHLVDIFVNKVLINLEFQVISAIN